LGGGTLAAIKPDAKGPDRANRSAIDSCALRADGTLRCWGSGGAQLGYGQGADIHIGDSLNEMPPAIVPLW
jgi:hypothetical protein